jgi:pimeloyl-ACP methyl ester carboxylesterase
MNAALHRLEIGPFIAVGHSLGGYVATLLGAGEPQPVSRQVFVDAGIGL